jgi:two-component system, chemotaxis family, sensor kinase CheA
MSLENNDLWKAFLEEVREQLEYLEQELLNAKSADADMINQLFRYFHSIKSSSAIFQFTHMEELAHAAETILDQVRRGVTETSDDVIGVLLACADTLKRQLKESEKTLEAPSANKPLLQELLSFRKEGVQEKPSVKTDEKDNLLGMETAELEEFSEMVEMALTNFFNFIMAKNPKSAIKSINRLIKAADRFELTKLSRTLSLLVKWAEDSDIETGTDKLFVLIIKLVEQIHTLEKLTLHAFSLAALYDNFNKLFASDYEQVLQSFITEIRQCHQEINNTQGISAASLSSLCEANDTLVNYFRIFDFTGSADLFRYFNQVCRKAIIGNIAPDIDIFNMIEAIVSEHAVAAGDPAGQHIVDDNAVIELNNFRDRLTQKQDDGFHRSERVATLTTLLNLDPDYMDYVENSEIELLEYCVKENKHIAIMIVDIEANQEWSIRFLHWLNQFEMITSRTVHCHKEINGKQREYTKTSFLLVFDEVEEVVRKSFAELGDVDLYVDEFSFRYPCHAASDEDTQAGNKVAASNTVADVDSSKTIRVNSDSIDRFVSQVGEMVLQRNMLSHALGDYDINITLKNCRSILDKSRDGYLNTSQRDELNAALASIADFYAQLQQANTKLAESVSRVQKDVMTLRVVPISIVFNRLPRVIRNINVDYGKDIRLQVIGEQVRVDKSMVDVLMEPLVHLVRNCADHGIEGREEREQLGKHEQAMIIVSAEQTGSYLEIRISDNGRGLKYEKIRARAVQMGLYNANAQVSEQELKMLIFRPGFSTSEKVTETSGRGVGMDAVRTRISAIGGSIELDSTFGKGTVFTLKLPVSAAIQGVILFSHGGETMTIPERNVELGLTIPVSQIQSVQGQAAFIHQGEIMPVYSISQLLGWGRFDALQAGTKQHQEVIIIADDNYHIGLAVDKVLDRQEIFVRELHSDLMSLPGVGGASILGNGEVVIILDAEAVLKIASKQSQSLEALLKVS